MNISQLKEIWREKGFRPNKDLGQNFLIDKNIRDSILNAMDLSPDSSVIEIGAGFGMMSKAVSGRCRALIAVEKDERVYNIARDILKDNVNIELIRGDILQVDVERLCEDESKVTVFGNIPYYISTPIIEKMINARKYVKNMYLVMQEELADRIVAPPGSKAYGSISCYVQYHAGVKKLLRIGKNSFYPRPQVNSSLVSFDFDAYPLVPVRDEALFFEIIRKAFSERRKKVLNSLSNKEFLGIERPEWVNILTSSGVDPNCRAETISLEDYAAVCDKVVPFISSGKA